MKVLALVLLLSTQVQASDMLPDSAADFAEHTFAMCERKAREAQEEYAGSELVYFHAQFSCMEAAYSTATEVMRKRIEEIANRHKPEGVLM